MARATRMTKKKTAGNGECHQDDEDKSFRRRFAIPFQEMESPEKESAKTGRQLTTRSEIEQEARAEAHAEAGDLGRDVAETVVLLARRQIDVDPGDSPRDETAEKI